MCISIFLTIYTYMCIYRYAYTSIYILSKYTYYVVSGLGRGLLQPRSHVYSKPVWWSSRLPAQLSIHYRPGCEALTPPADQRLVPGMKLCDMSPIIWHKKCRFGEKNNMIWKVPTHLFVLSNQSVINKLVMARERLPQLGSFCILPHHHFSGFSIQSLAFWWCWKDLKGIKVCAAKSSKGLQYL